MTTVFERILNKHGMTEKTALKYVDGVVRRNNVETAEIMNMSDETVKRYKDKFDRMSETERWIVIAELSQRKQRDLFNRWVRGQSERSEANER
jgi:hypothetical protein